MFTTPLFYLKRIPLFQNLSDDELELLSVRLGKRALRPGERIFEQDDPGDTMYTSRGHNLRFLEGLKVEG